MHMHFILVQIFPLWSRGTLLTSKPYINDTKKPIYIHLVFTKLIGRVIKSRGTPIQNGEILLLPLKNSITREQEFLKFSIEERRMRKNVIIKLLLVKRHLI